jgi:signal transduction histidine kinase
MHQVVSDLLGNALKFTLHVDGIRTGQDGPGDAPHP